jgi:hypothetical protein
MTWARLAVFGASVLAAASVGSIVDVAMAAALSTAGFTVGCLFYLPKVLPVSATRILLEFFRIFITALVMFATVRVLHSHEIQSHFVTLPIDVATGAAVFSVILYLSWIAAGRPDGPEKRLVSILSDKLRIRAKRP